METSLNALILGATGAVGRELVRHLLISEKWANIYCIVRKQLPQWATTQNKHKLKLITGDMDKLFKTEEWSFSNIDAVMCCLGCQIGNGEQMFRKVDKTYPLLAADIALRNKIPHYLLLSSEKTDPNSLFLYLRVKGQTERDLKQKKLNLVSIIKPGLIDGRQNPRMAERIFSFLPFFPKIQCKHLALSMKLIAQKYELQANKMDSNFNIYGNSDLLNIVKKQK